MALNTSNPSGNGRSFAELRAEVARQRADEATTVSDPFMEECVSLAQEGDLLELLSVLRHRNVVRNRARDFAMVRLALRQLRKDLPRLSEAFFGVTVAFAFELQLRYLMNVEERLAACSQAPDGLPALPHDSENEELILRVERIARFIAELLAGHARITHVRQIKRDPKGRNGNERGSKPNRSPMARDRSPVACSTPAPVNGRLRSPEGPFPFT